MCLRALFLLFFNIIILCGIISLLQPYKTLGNEVFPSVTHVKFPLPKIRITVNSAHDMDKTGILLISPPPCFSF